jgi:uncharacterized protein YjgD (DUF1641 family)
VTDTIAPDRTTELEAKIDALTVQVQFLTDEAVEQRRRRISMEELQADLTPIATRAIGNAAIALDEAKIDPGDLISLAVRVAENADLLEKAVAQLESINDLVVDVMPIVKQGIELAIEKAAILEEAGYFDFIEAGIGVVDRIVTGYSKEDVEALGDNVVQMLDIVKDLTQPDMLAVTQRMLDVVHRQGEISGETMAEPPGFLALAGKIRDPEVRMGIGRALDTLKAVSAAADDTSQKSEDNQPTPMEVHDATSSDS